MGNIFEIDKVKNIRRVNPLATYKDNATRFLVKKYCISVEKAEEIITKAIAKKGYDDPIVHYYEKDKDTLDKSQKEMKLSTYINTIEKESLTIAPSFTCYNKLDVDGNKWVSTHAKLMMRNKDLRNKHKKLAKIAESKKDMVEAEIQQTIQGTKKTNNNSYSGAACQLHLPFATHSSHYTFTSTTRLVTSTANVITESIIGGYRLYMSPEDVLNHFIAIIGYHDLEKVSVAVSHYNMYIPTVKDIMDAVRYNIYYFWDNNSILSSIEDFVMKLTDIERCAVFYLLDLRAIITFNQANIGDIIYDATVPKTGISSDLTLLDKTEGYKLNMLYHILSDRLVNKGLDHHAHKGTPLADVMVSTLVNIDRGLDKLSILVDGFFKTEVLPPNIANYKQVPRKTIGLSDTDSTVGVYQELVKQKFGHNRLSPATIGYVSILAVFVSEVTVNMLSILSTNMNVFKDKLSVLSMKSEYFFPFLAPSTASKHYLTLDMIVEMLIKDNEKVGFHGVSLISAKIADEHNKFKEEIAAKISDAVMKGVMINPVKLIEETIALENTIEERILNADPSILSYGDIKNMGSYNSDPHKSPFFHNMLWQGVFKDKYGAAPEPPYLSLKIPLTTNTKRKFADYVNNIDDENIRDKWINIMTKYNKLHIGTLQIPNEVIVEHGIPDELIPIIDTPRLILAQTSSIRLVLSLCGIGIKDSVLLRDTYLFK